MTATCEYWSLVNVPAVQVSPETPALAVPAAAWETIASPPSLMLVQFGPRLPLARLKLSEPITALVVQEMATLVMLAEAMVPEPLATVQVWPVGLVLTVTL